jgi:hypothetical protein
MAQVRASRRKHHIIYKTTCLVTGRYYIGMHSTDDLNDNYLGSGVRLKRSINKYGQDQHVRVILEDLPSRDAAAAREKELITPELRADRNCMNCGAGGLGAVDRPATSEETRRKMSIARKGKPHTPEWSAKIGAAHKGKKISPEAIQKRLVTLKERGYKPTEETIRKQREGQQASEKFKKRRRPLIVDGVMYESGCAAVKALGIPGSTLHYRLKSPSWKNYSWITCGCRRLRAL